MRSKGAKIPEQWESLEDADISELTNTFAYNLSQDPIYFMAKREKRKNDRKIQK